MKHMRALFIAVLAAMPAACLSAATGESGWIGRWYPGIGDPTIAGWITVVAYFAAMAYCIVLNRSLRGVDGDSKRLRRERALWGILAVALALLGINKQLDLQSAMTEALRLLAKSEGWYKDRGIYQALFIVALGLVALVAVCALAYLTRKLPLGAKLSATGLVLIVGFVLIRASSFHHMDRLIQSRVLSIKANWILELGGIAIVWAGALLRRRELKRTRIRAVPSA